MCRVRRAGALIAVVFCWLGGPAAVEAGTLTAGLTAQITVTASCTINAATLDFGANSGSSLLVANVDTSTTMSVTCTSGSPYAIGMDYGANALGTLRRLGAGLNFLIYNLYLDSAHTNPWLSAAGNSSCQVFNSCYLGTGSGSAQSINIYGSVLSVGIAPPNGTYTDTITMTVTY